MQLLGCQFFSKVNEYIHGMLISFVFKRLGCANLLRFRSLEGLQLILCNISRAAFESTSEANVAPETLFQQMKVSRACIGFSRTVSKSGQLFQLKPPRVHQGVLVDQVF